MPSRRQSAGQPREEISVESVFGHAQSLHVRGKLDQAEQLYRAILQDDGNHVGSLHNLGILCFQQGRYDDAVVLTREVVRLRPDLAVAHNTLGVALRHLSRLEEAEACCREALRLAPDYAEAHNTLADVLTARRRWSEAEACCRAALRLQPEYAEAHNNLGTALAGLGRQEEAEFCCREALRLKPGNAAALNNLGTVLIALGRLEEAEGCFREAVRLAPENAAARSNLGTVLRALGRPQEAVAPCREVLRLKPGNAEALHDFCIALAEAHHNLRIALAHQQELREAAACLENAAPPALPTPVPNLQNIVVATSIPPEISRRDVGKEVGRQYQAECLRSWTDAGFRVLSLNPPEEIAGLSDRYPEVSFIPASRDASRLSGRKNPLIADLLTLLAAQPEPVVGIINSDIRLGSPERWRRIISADVANSVIIGQRCEIDSPSNVVGRTDPYGFDYFFFERNAANEILEGAPAFALGLPWWDFWLPLALRFKARELKVRDRPRAFHLAHATAWEPRIWRYFAAHLAAWIEATHGAVGVSIPSGIARLVDFCTGISFGLALEGSEGDHQRHLLAALCCAAIRGLEDGQE